MGRTNHEDRRDRLKPQSARTTESNAADPTHHLEFWFGPSMRLLIGALLWVGALFILAGQVIGIAWILTVVVGVPKVWGCVIGGVVVTTYFYTLIAVGLFVPLLAGLFVPRVRTAGALASTIAGVAAVLVTDALGHPGPRWMTPAIWGLLAALAAVLVWVPIAAPTPKRAGLT